MLDRRFVVENAALVKQNCLNRGSKADIDRLVLVESQRKAKQADVEECNRRANEVSKSIGKAKDAEEREARKNEGRELREKTVALQAELDALEAEADAILRTIPNLSHPQAPVGGDDQSNLEVRRGKHEPRKFDFKPLDHVELGEKLGLMDFEGGAKVAGHGFYFLKNDAVLLELALQRYAIDLLIKEGFTPTITPDLARNEILQGTGYIPRGPETQIYSIADSDLSLVATAEITLGGLLSGQILEAEQLPIKVCGISHCYRTEAGAGGRASRGLYRVHQFTKVEMFAFTLPDQSDPMLEYFCELEGRIFDGLGIPYRVVDTATGDLGGPAYRKYDLEAWMPGRGNGGEYGEVTSTSNCTDFQARRLGIRYRNKGEKGTSFVHTLNGTAVAISRAIIAVLENYQQADGTIAVPEALRAWMGKDRIGGEVGHFAGAATQEFGVVHERQSFWREAFAVQGSITPHVMPYVLSMGAIAAGICVLGWLTRAWFGITIDLEMAPFELVGTALGLLLILRTNAGYDRWWEARKLWGAIVNQSRNLVISALAYGPNDRRWQESLVTWVAVFPHAVRCHLRGEPPSSEIVRLLGPEGAERLGAAPHMPNQIALALAELLREACERFDMDRFVFLQIDRERALLIDHMGGCERILKTPLPMVYAIKIRRFIALFLLTLPLALLHRITHVWMVPIITMMVAYPMLSLDQTGIELQNPFSKANVGHLPLTDISNTIEQNVLGLLKEKQATAGDSPAGGNGQPGFAGEIHSQS